MKTTRGRLTPTAGLMSNSTPTVPRYEVINVRPKHKAKQLLDELVGLMDEETGVRPSTGDALAKAIKEAIILRKQRAKSRGQ